ncbi:MAG: DUF4349 domain-containing protein [Scytonematopsis contorta HA4267-MV1]|jgi:hypothetical protein|nr:DUF4349 domain-containing protein [Scytonematopsis contorta HA4267-MV1]
MKKPVFVFSLLIGGVILTSCANQSANEPSLGKAESTSTLSQPAAAPATQDALQNQAQNTSQNTQITPAPRQRSQLIKKAAMTLIVNSVEKTIDSVSKIINKQQGDLIKLEQKQPKNDNARHTATIQLRIPHNLLEPTLSELAKLGTVQSRNISAQDVGEQLVDLQARLTNLQKTEANLQKIMDKSGSVKDILSVSQELSNVRQSIEQINAQLKNLQNQVSYSTITLNLEAAVSSSNQGRGLGSQVQESWNNSTNSLGKVTVGLLKLSIWLMVYSPVLLILAGGIYGLQRWRRNSRPAD